MPTQTCAMANSWRPRPTPSSRTTRVTRAPCSRRSIPRSADRAAEHFIAVTFTRPGFIEVAFARFKLVDGKGCSFVYSHRVYGEKIGEQMKAWLGANGGAVETALIEWDLPSPASLRRERL